MICFLSLSSCHEKATVALMYSIFNEFALTQKLSISKFSDYSRLPASYSIYYLFEATKQA